MLRVLSNFKLDAGF